MSSRLGDDGSALLEFVIVGVGILLPIALLGQVAAGVQRAAFAATQAVRESGRAFVTAPTVREARVRAHVAADLALADQGLAAPVGSLRIACVAGPCLAPGSAVIVDLAWRVPPGVEIRATHRVPVDDYRSEVP